jgi:hypothetical protein
MTEAEEVINPQDELLKNESSVVTPVTGEKIDVEQEAQSIAQMKFDPYKLTAVLMILGERMIGCTLYKYQKRPAFRIIYSVLAHDGAEITLLFSRQSGKCFKKGTKILMHNLETKNVEDIVVGDLLMGVDSKPRKVLSLARGNEQMYECAPRTEYGKSYTVNESHILAFKERLKSGELISRELTVSEYLKEPQWKQKDCFVGYRVPLTFESKDTAIDPYFLGLWLGDGNSADLQIATKDFEIVTYLEEYAKNLGLSLSCYQDKEKKKCPMYAISSGKEKGRKKSGSNKLLDAVKNYSLLKNKHIPNEFLQNSKEVRLAVLAGLIDSDGHRSKKAGKENNCEITFKNKKLAEDVVFLARSIGLRATITPKTGSIKKINFSGTYWRISIYGDLSEVPTKIERKKYACAGLRENPTNYGFDLVAKGLGDYYGFTLEEGDRLFLLDDLTVVHNTEVVSFVVMVLGVFLPVLSKYFPELEHFKFGCKMGAFAPQLDQVETLYGRCLEKIWSDSTRHFLSDPDIADYPLSRAHYKLKSGSFLMAQSGAKQSKIESKTYHICFIDESQDMDTEKVRKSIIPMLASTFGTIIRLGTPNRNKGDFYGTIKNNKAHDAKLRKSELETKQLHFEYDYKEIIKYRREQYKLDNKPYHLLYEKSVERDMLSMGRYSESFRMAYGLEWLLEIGMFITDKGLEDLVLKKSMGFPKLDLKRDFTVAGLDIASARASTVLTTGILSEPVKDVDDRPKKTILEWLELANLDYERQFEEVSNSLIRNKVKVLYADYTGVGRVFVDRLLHHFGEHILIVPYLFTPQTKSDMWKRLDEDIVAGRIHVPAHKNVECLDEFKNFCEQMLNLQKMWKGSYMICDKLSGYKDDYPDSLALMNLAGNHLYIPQAMMEVLEENTIFGRNSGRGGMIKDSRY